MVLVFMFILQIDSTAIETQRNIGLNIAKIAISSNVHTGKH